MESWALAIERIVAVLEGGWFAAQIVAFVLLRHGYGSSGCGSGYGILSGSRRNQLDRYRRSLVASLLGMTLSSLNSTVYGFLEARVDFDRFRSTC